MPTLEEKYETLQELLRGYGSVLVAYSSGVDSTFLLRVAHDVLGDRCFAATASAASFPDRERDEAMDYADELGVRHEIFFFDEFSVPGFAENPENRCYLCKKELFTQMRALAEELGAAELCEGSNVDDLGDYRPGLQAIAELGIRSPLREAGLTKAEIRELSRRLGLPTWDKPSFACLASRFPYHHRITETALKRVDRAEQFLLDRGFSEVRVRVHGTVARIEVRPEERIRLVSEPLASEIDTRFKELGFLYVSADLLGYRTGSMNDTITQRK